MRQLSPVERLWLTAEALDPPFAILFVVEGPAPHGLDAAVEKAAIANPGCSARLEGWLAGCRWVFDGGVPPVRHVPTVFEAGTVSTEQLQGLEVVVHPNAVVFRCRHALIDGRGVVHFAREVYRALRGEPLVGSTQITDLELVGSGETVAYPPEIHGAVTGTHAGDPTLIWDGLRIPGRFSAVTGRVIAAVTAEARSYDERVPICVHVPVDLRREGRSATANLTGMVFVPGGEDPLTNQGQIRTERPRAAAWVRAQAPLKWVPLWLMRVIGGRGQARSVARSRFGATAVVSNLGRLELGDFQGPGTRSTTVRFIGPGSKATAAFIGLLGVDGGVEVTVVMPRGLADGGRLDKLLEQIRTRFT